MRDRIKKYLASVANSVDMLNTHVDTKAKVLKPFPVVLVKQLHDLRVTSGKVIEWAGSTAALSDYGNAARGVRNVARACIDMLDKIGNYEQADNSKKKHAFQSLFTAIKTVNGSLMQNKRLNESM